jgi:protein farnesyltransferase/geranylgeranyltransferase type-1 subunit alpha
VRLALTFSRLYRAKTLLSLPNSNLSAELDFLAPISLQHLKNYQIWHHRQTIVTKLGTWEQDPPFIVEMLAQDTKNYHVWSYRQWLVGHFDLWDEASEHAAIDKLLEEDLRNNSAWNHRWFLTFGRPNGSAALKNPAIVNKEWDWALKLAEKAPQNESAWNYLRALAEKADGEAKMDYKKVIEQVLPFVQQDGQKKVKSSYALDVLAGLYAETGQVDEACNALDLLADVYDPIREGYWHYRKELAKAQVSAGV